LRRGWKRTPVDKLQYSIGDQALDGQVGDDHRNLIVDGNGGNQSARGRRKSKWPKPAKSGAMLNDFRDLDPSESKQNGKIKTRETLENRAAAAAHI
jgi:hypothetical protein